MTIAKHAMLLALKEYIERKGIPTAAYIDLSGDGEDYCPIGFLLAHGGMNTQDLLLLGTALIKSIFQNVEKYETCNSAVEILHRFGFVSAELDQLELTEYEDDPAQAALDWINTKLDQLKGESTDDAPDDSTGTPQSA